MTAGALGEERPTLFLRNATGLVREVSPWRLLNHKLNRQQACRILRSVDHDK